MMTLSEEQGLQLKVLYGADESSVKDLNLSFLR